MSTWSAEQEEAYNRLRAVPRPVEADSPGSLASPTPSDVGQLPDAESAAQYPETISAKALLQKSFPPPVWVVDHTLPVGLAILAGRPKFGKSWLVLQWSVEVARSGHDVLYLALEDPERRLFARLQKQLHGEAPPERLEFATAWPRFDANGAGKIESWLKAHPHARLVVIDTFARIRNVASGMRSSSNPYQQDYDDAQELKRLVHLYNVAVLVVHHTRKMDAGDPLDLVNGTTGVTGPADTVLVMKRESGRADATLYLRGRDVPENDLAMSFDESTCTWSMLGDAKEFRRSPERQEIIDLLSAEPLQPKEIADALSRSPAAIRKMLMDMRRAGEVVSDGKKYRPGDALAGMASDATERYQCWTCGQMTATAPNAPCPACAVQEGPIQRGMTP